jgi:hypothetical protein
MNGTIIVVETDEDFARLLAWLKSRLEGTSSLVN